MLTKLRLATAFSALVVAVVMVWQQTPPGRSSATAGAHGVQLRSTAAPLAPPPTSSKPVNLTNPRPFDACEDIPFDVIAQLGLAFTPPKPVEGVRCEFDAGNYQMAVETFVWRSYDETLPPDAIEMDIGGHRAAQYWVMKPTEWNNRWWFSCMVAFKTSYGLIQQSLYYSPVYSNPDMDCQAENLMRAHQLAPHYKY
ncbi:DUF3558 domain-containing protein [Mycolicibacter terrae]|uniref:DUF3558 domain-containing protein n=2 Tax=Mycolicibacter TaxID=1073531 RepID=A0A1A2XQ94_MYCSD|nr:MULTISPECIES: DUF3558 family protein [Mycolicibacter]OBH18725.1 DUF3558 domain-containing protein [Mycolicibacter sinensis]OBI27237.1 DUF3558 domain-containing protein [Mycolicibacter sinensis]RRR42707.1 DUF3558 domain-containing protein [Mycolicibacter terrae]